MADPRDFQRAQADFQPERGGLRAAPVPAAINFVPVQQTTDVSQGLAALASLEPEITGFFDRKVKKMSEEEMAAGREAAMKEALDYSEAVRQGKIAPNQSKWFMKGYKSQYGEVLGQQWATEAKTAWTKSEAKNSDSPTAANEFITNFIKDKLQTAPGMDPDVRAGLLPHMGNMRSAIMQAQAEWSAKQVMEKSLENFGTLITQDLDAFVRSGGKMSVNDLTAAIKKRDAEGRLMGIDNDTLNRTVVQAVTAKAREMGSQSLLNVLKAYEFIGNNPKYANDIRSASDAITSKAASMASLAWTQEQRARLEATRYAKMEAVAFINANPGLTDLPPELKKKLILSDPESLPWVQSYQRTMTTEATKQRPEEIAKIEQAVYSAGPRAAEVINDLLDRQVLRDPAFTQHLMTVARANDEWGLLSEKPYVDGRQEILNLAKQDGLGNAMLDVRAAQDAADAYGKAWIEWRIANPRPSSAEAQAKQSELKRIFTDAAKTSTGMSSGKTTYDRFNFDTEVRKARINERLLQDQKVKKREADEWDALTRANLP